MERCFRNQKNEIVLTYEMIMELLETGKHVFPSEEWIQKAEQLGRTARTTREGEKKRVESRTSRRF